MLTFVNRLKESDVTWLYGPLKPATSHPISSSPPESLSRNTSFINKKPILKKRSLSEVMLQKSISTSSLVKQAAESVQAQQTKQRTLNRSDSEFRFSSVASSSSQPPSREELDYFSSVGGSVVGETPSDGREEKHIRFDERVEQCVAVVPSSGLYYEDETENDPPNSALSESSSDEGLMMRKSPRPPQRNGKGRLSRSNSFSGAKMIETIEATTLKYRTDSPDNSQSQLPQHHTFGRDLGDTGGSLHRSNSQLTLRPSRPSRNFILADDDDDDEEGEDSTSWSFGSNNPQSSLGASSASPSSSGGAFNQTDGFVGMEGMRRTESGMFMPIDDEDDVVAAGLFGRVTDTVNTVKDIGWVLWNSFSARRDS